MIVINPNPTDKANIQAKIDEQKAIISAADALVLDIDKVQIPSIDSKEATNKKFYDKQNDIIVNYELELKYLNGVYLLNPITEADLQNIQTGRLWANQAAELIRIPEFDGNGPTGQASDYYTLRLSTVAPATTRLTSGLTTTTAVTAPVTTTVTPASTTFTSATNLTPLLNREFVMSAGSRSFIGAVTGVTSAPLVVPTTWTATFTFISLLNSGDSLAGATVTGTFVGFSNADRSTKTTAADRQQIMDYYLNVLHTNIDGAITSLSSQKTAITANNDPNIGTVGTVVQAELDYYTNYVTTMDISDIGIGALNATTANAINRSNIRITEIPTKKSAYYDKRYFWAVERSGSGGTITQRWRVDLSRASALDRKAKAQAKLNTLLAGVT